MENGVISFTAIGMRKLAHYSQHELEKKEFENAKDKIIAAAQQGHYSLNLTLDYAATIKALQALDFNVYHATDISITTYASGKVPTNYYEINWKEE